MTHPFDDIYAKVPAVRCAGHCGRDRHNTCCGPIPCTVVEREILEGYNGTTCSWIEKDPTTVQMDLPILTHGLVCPHLGLSGRCEAYAVRPLICRLWGTVKALKCPWGCQPERWLTDVEAASLIREAKNRS